MDNIMKSTAYNVNGVPDRTLLERGVRATLEVRLYGAVGVKISLSSPPATLKITTRKM